MAFLNHIFGKQKQSIGETFMAYAEGKLIDISEVSDLMFAQEMMGKSVAIEPSKGLITAPCDATMSLVYKTKHALGFITKSGAELLVHIGVDTVNLKGEHFHVLVEEGDKVSSGQPLVEFELEAIVEKNYSPVTIMVVTNSDDFQKFEKAEPKKVNLSDTILVIEK